MSTLLVDQGTTGLEEIQREAYLVLFDNLNSALAEVEAHWAASDQSLADHIGIEYVPTTLEPVETENFHEGHRPSLINAPIEKYPNISVMCFRAMPGPGNDVFDHIDVYRDTLWVEVMVKSVTDEGECNRRAQRMATAANLCVMANKTLHGIVSGHDGGPAINVTDLFTRKEKNAYGQLWFWQGARLEYTVRKEAVTPSSTTGSFLRTQSPYSIDQA